MVGINNLIGNVFILIFVGPIQAKNPLYHYIEYIKIGGKPMLTKELFEKYAEEICPTCKNRNYYLCNITITNNGKETKAKCSYYEKEG